MPCDASALKASPLPSPPPPRFSRFVSHRNYILPEFGVNGSAGEVSRRATNERINFVFEKEGKEVTKYPLDLFNASFSILSVMMNSTRVLTCNLLKLCDLQKFNPRTLNKDKIYII